MVHFGLEKRKRLFPPWPILLIQLFLSEGVKWRRQNVGGGLNFDSEISIFCTDGNHFHEYGLDGSFFYFLDLEFCQAHAKQPAPSA